MSQSQTRQELSTSYRSIVNVEEVSGLKEKQEYIGSLLDGVSRKNGLKFLSYEPETGAEDYLVVNDEEGSVLIFSGVAREGEGPYDPALSSFKLFIPNNAIEAHGTHLFFSISITGYVYEITEADFFDNQVNVYSTKLKIDPEVLTKAQEVLEDMFSRSIR